MITNFFIPELNNHDVQELWFQQDSATCHTARATIDLLKDTFGDRLISRFGPVNWPPRSCDLTPLDYFLWGYVKSLVYADKPQTLDHLEDNIRRVIDDIRPQMLEKVIENWTSKLDFIRASRGRPMPEIIFKIFHGFFHFDSMAAFGSPRNQINECGLHLKQHEEGMRTLHEYNQDKQNIKKKGASVESLLDDGETDQTRVETDEITNIKPDRESKFEKRDEHETFELKGKFSNAT
ncbi:uncharacterized protein TNCV_2988011 [Trichonephila clavipes]|nr:uncharacterized protein TNCV_2988011 [Trichonephila clavipes]